MPDVTLKMNVEVYPTEAMRDYAQLYREMEVAADEAHAARLRYNALRDQARHAYLDLAKVEAAKFDAALEQLGVSPMGEF